MALIELLMLGAGAWAIGHGIKESKEREEARQRRRNTPCYFCDDVSQADFYNAVGKAKKQIRRLNSLEANGPFVYGRVVSQSGISEWEFEIDFNDYGHITGNYWISSDNDDSDIPRRVAQIICGEIK